MTAVLWVLWASLRRPGIRRHRAREAERLDFFCLVTALLDGDDVPGWRLVAAAGRGVQP